MHHQGSPPKLEDPPDGEGHDEPEQPQQEGQDAPVPQDEHHVVGPDAASSP